MADEQPPTETPAERPPSRTWTALRVGAISGVIGAAAAGGGVWYSETQQANAQEAAMQGDIDACEERAAAHQAEVASLTQDVRILQVRMDLTRATAELEQRNFGTAEEHLDKAREHYGDLSPAPSAEVGNALANTKLEISADLHQQVQALEALTARIDALLSGS